MTRPETCGRCAWCMGDRTPRARGYELTCPHGFGCCQNCDQGCTVRATPDSLRADRAEAKARAESWRRALWESARNDSDWKLNLALAELREVREQIARWIDDAPPGSPGLDLLRQIITPSTVTQPDEQRDEYCGCGCGHCAKKAGWPVDGHGRPVTQPDPQPVASPVTAAPAEPERGECIDCGGIVHIGEPGVFQNCDGEPYHGKCPTEPMKWIGRFPPLTSES